MERGPGPDVARGTDEFVAVGWDAVLDRLAAELARVYGGPGPEAVFGGSYGWSSPGRFHHAQTQVHRFLNSLGGYVRSVNTYSIGTSEVVLPRIFGRRGDLLRSFTAWPLIAAHTELLVCFGGIPAKNLAVAPGGVTRHRSVGHLTEMVRRGGEVVLAGPDRADHPAGLPARWLPLRPGTDVALMLALCRVLVAEGLHDAGFLATHCAGADEALAYLDGSADGVEKSPRWAEGICGVPADTIVALAREMAARHTMVAVSWSLQRAEHGEQPVWAGVLLAALLGRMGLPGAGFGHGYGSMADIGVPVNGVGPPTLPQLVNPVRTAIPVARIADMLLSPGAAYTYNGERRRYPYVELVYWSGGNPFHHHQDLARLRRAFRAVSTVVVHEPYWTATARHADVVLPATVTLERDDIGAVRTDPYLTAMHRHAPPFAQARDDYAIFSDLAERLGVGKAFTEGRDADGWLRHIYEQWRRRYGAAPDFDSFWRTGRVALDPSPPQAVPRRLPRRPGRAPARHAERADRAALGHDRRRTASPTAPATRPGWSRGSGTALRGPRPTRWCCWPTTRPRACTASWTSARTAPRARSPGASRCGCTPTTPPPAGSPTGELVRVFNDRGACLAGLRVSADLLPGVVQMSTGAWFSPVDDPGGAPVLCTAGNVNVLTPDVGSSGFSQGCAGARALVEVQRWDGRRSTGRERGPPPVRGG